MGPSAEKDAGIVAEDFRIEVRDHSNDFRVYHEPCDMTLIVTQSVSLATLARRASEHACVIPPVVCGCGHVLPPGGGDADD